MAKKELRKIIVAGLCGALLVMPFSTVWADDGYAAQATANHIADQLDLAAAFYETAAAQEAAGDGENACLTMRKSTTILDALDEDFTKLRSYQYDYADREEAGQKALLTGVEMRNALYYERNEICARAGMSAV